MRERIEGRQKYEKGISCFFASAPTAAAAAVTDDVVVDIMWTSAET